MVQIVVWGILACVATGLLGALFWLLYLATHPPVIPF